MNKIFNINLGGYAFTIDEDAYEHLRKYLDTIHNHFRASEGYEDITSDIETRMAELMQESIQSRQIVMIKDVRTAIAIMGTPEEFGAVPSDEDAEDSGFTNSSDSSAAGSGSSASFSSSIKTGKRLLRNPEDKVLGGVCSGIAAYFGISDPVWIRLAFVAFSFLVGSATFLYIILWAIMKEAKTPADFLAMRGEAINVNNIARMVEKEFDNISDSFGNFGDKKKRSKVEGGLSNFLSKFFAFTGQVLQALLHFIASVASKLGLVVGIVMLIIVVGGWIFLFGSSVFIMPILDFVLPGTEATKGLVMTSMGILGLVPLLALILGLLRAFFKIRIGTGWHVGLWTVWTISLVSLVFMVSRFSRSFNVKESVTETITLPNPATDSLIIGFLPNPYSESMIQFGNLKLSEDRLSSEDVSLELKVSKDGNFHLEKLTTARANTRDEARHYASSLDAPVTIQGDQVNLATFFELKERTSYQKQEVSFILYVPENKSVTFLESQNSLYPFGEFDYDRLCGDNHVTRVYKMEKAKLHCTSDPSPVESADQPEEAPIAPEPAQAPQESGQ